MAQLHCILLALAFLVVIMSAHKLFYGASDTEGIAFPFGPIDPDEHNPFNAQSIFGQPSQLFQLSSNTDNAPYGAYQALQAMQARSNYVAMRNPQWETSSNFSTDGNSVWALSLANPPMNAWDYL